MTWKYTHPSWTFRRYVNVMILFFTSSLSISTDVPCAVAEPPFVRVVDATDSDCSDCTSASRDIEPAPVGVGIADTKWRPVAEDTVLVWVAELGLKDVRRFCADDFRRILGRCI